MTSRWIDIDGPVHFVDFGGPSGPPPILCVHGLGGSHLNWLALAPVLARRHRVFAIDLVGFGHTRTTTPTGRRRARLRDNVAVVGAFVDRVFGEPVVMLGHSMGGLIAMLHGERRPDSVAALILLAPSTPWAPGQRPDLRVLWEFAPFLIPPLGAARLARRRQRLSPEQDLERQIAFGCADPSRVDSELLQRHADFARERSAYPERYRDVAVAANTLLRTLSIRPRFWRRVEAVPAPALALFGAEDRLVPAAQGAELHRRRPDWDVRITPGVGHLANLEAPEETAEQIIDWLGRRNAST